MSTGINIPAIKELAGHNQWVLWRTIERKGRPTKVPFNPSGKPAKVNDPKTWAHYRDAATVLSFSEMGEEKYDGLGFVFTEDCPVTGIDLDKCRDAKTGQIEPWAQAIIKRVNSYTEISPTGTGVHILIKGKPDLPRNRKGKIEVYKDLRYFTVTGQHLKGTPDKLEERADRLVGIFNDEEPPANPQPIPADLKPTGNRDIDALAKEINAAVQSDAEPPFEKFEALCDNAPVVRQTWDRKPSHDDWSASEWDLALASYFVAAQWTPSEITAALIAHRRRHGSDLKLRADYYARTIKRAHSSKNRADSNDFLTDGEASEIPEITERREKILTAMSEGFFGERDVKILRIVKYTSDPPLYKILTNQGAVVGESSMLLTQRSFQRAMLEAADVVIPLYKNPKWFKIVQHMMDIAEIESIGTEATDKGQAESWIQRYLLDRPPPKTFTTDAVVEGNPFIYLDDLFIIGTDMLSWLKQSLGVSIGSKKFGAMLRAAGCNPDTKSVMKDDGTYTSRSVWRVQTDLWKGRTQ